MKRLASGCAAAACAIAFAHGACAGDAAAPPARPALELVGTLVDATSRFAIVRRDDRMVSVRVGDDLDGLTVAAITQGRVDMRSRDGTLRRISLGEPGSRARDASAAPADDTVFNDPTYTGRIAQGVNTDQSLPEHPVRGPTASLPQGIKETRH